VHRLSGFGVPINLMLGASQRLGEDPEIAMALNLAEAPLGFQVRERSSALDHFAITPAAHAPRDAAKRAVGVFDDVGRGQAANERRGESALVHPASFNSCAYTSYDHSSRWNRGIL